MHWSKMHHNLFFFISSTEPKLTKFSKLISTSFFQHRKPIVFWICCRNTTFTTDFFVNIEVRVLYFCKKSPIFVSSVFLKRGGCLKSEQYLIKHTHQLKISPKKGCSLWCNSRKMDGRVHYRFEFQVRHPLVQTKVQLWSLIKNAHFFFIFSSGPKLTKFSKLILTSLSNKKQSK